MRSVVQVYSDPPISLLYGAIAQLGERLPCTQEVSSSILLSSTKTYFLMFFNKLEKAEKEFFESNFEVIIAVQLILMWVVWLSE